jgi:UDPglucose 6-dehydrogenase
MEIAMEGGNIRFLHCGEVEEELGDVALVAVGTPPGEGYSVELGQVEAAVNWVRKRAPRGLVLAMKSTVPPGTGARIRERELRGSGIGYAANPEFLRVGQAVRDWDFPDRIVIGTAPGDSRSLEIIYGLYNGIDSPVLATDITTAEMVKYASSAFLATRISFVNEMAAICDRVGASIDDVSKGLAMDSRTGARIFAGVGYGGPCLPKDIGALLNLARQAGSSPELLQTVAGVNQRQWQLPLRALRDRFGDRLNGLKVAVLGLAFKPETGDLTEAPAVKLALALAEEGAELTAYDPSFTNSGNVDLPVAMRVAPDALTATTGTQAAVVMTEWSEIVEADWAAAKRLMAPPWFIFDGRNALDHKAMKSMGFEYRGVGRGR